MGDPEKCLCPNLSCHPPTAGRTDLSQYTGALREIAENLLERPPLLVGHSSILENVTGVGKCSRMEERSALLAGPWLMRECPLLGIEEKEEQVGEGKFILG